MKEYKRQYRELDDETKEKLREAAEKAQAIAKELAETIELKKTAGGVDDSYEADLLKKISTLTAKIYSGVQELEKAVDGAAELSDAGKTALYYRNTVFAKMGDLRELVDELEGYVPACKWPVPSYGEMLFSVR